MKTLRAYISILLINITFVAVSAINLHAEKRIGVIFSGDIPYYRAMHKSFVADINTLAPEGERIDIIVQTPFPNQISWHNAARKLIALDVDLIVTYGAPATNAVINTKSHIPLVYAGLYDAELIGAAGKNVTGCGFKVPLSSIVRYFKRIKPVDTLGIVFSGIEEDSVHQYKSMREIAEQQNVKVVKIDIRTHEDLEKLKKRKLDAVFISGSSIAHLWIEEILSILHNENIPTADIFPGSSESGVLMALYHPAHFQGQKAAEMAAQILQGKETRSIYSHIFRETELVFNLITARHLGIAFPIQLIIEATRVIR